jgi:hypothetical protein
MSPMVTLLLVFRGYQVRISAKKTPTVPIEDFRGFPKFPRGKIPVYYFKLSHAHFLQHRFQSIIHYDLTIRPYLFCVIGSVLK